MNDRYRRYSICILLITALLLVAAAFSFAASYLPFQWLKIQIDSYARHGTADKFTVEVFEKIVLRLRITAAAMFFAAGLLYSARRKAERYVSDALASLVSFFRSLAHDIRDAAGREDWMHLCAFFIILAGAIAVRVAALSRPMHTDEAYTFNVYVSKPLYIGLTYYSAPNNHLFHTFLSHISYVLFGNHPWAIRLPALVAGILVVPASYVFIRIFYNRDAALLTAAVVAASSMLIRYSAAARGYSIICLIFLSLLALAAYLRQGGNTGAWLLFAVLSATGFYTIPIMLYPFGIVVIWLFLSIMSAQKGAGRRSSLKTLSVYTAVTLLLTLILYAPVLAVSGIKPLVANPWVVSRSWSYFAERFPPSLVSLWNYWNRDIPTALSLVLAGGFIVSLVFHRRLSPYRIPVAAVAVIWCLPVVAAQRVVPDERIWLFLLPVYIGPACAGAAFLPGLLRMKKGRFHAIVFPILAVALSFWLSWGVLHSQRADTVYDYRPVTFFLKEYLRPGDRVIDAYVEQHPSSIYYRRLYNIPDRYFSGDPASGSRILIIVDGPMKTAGGILRKKGLSAADYTDPELIRRYRFLRVYEIKRRHQGKER
ncbi:MAG: hypothetical protein GXP46_02275 [Deferribacteres bacterium]|nr:hypothetical protein [Deferribacteres bacterium]